MTVERTLGLNAEQEQALRRELISQEARIVLAIMGELHKHVTSDFKYINIQSPYVNRQDGTRLRFTSYMYGAQFPLRIVPLPDMTKAVDMAAAELLEALLEDIEDKTTAVWRKSLTLEPDFDNNGVVLSCRVAFE